jgi:53 kDa membrane antigen A
MFTITEGGSLTLNQVGSTVSLSTGQITISGTPGTPINVDFKDILVKNDKIYILFAKNSLPSVTPPAHYYSLGGMLEYTYNSSGITNYPQKYGFNDTVTAGDDIVTAGEANFYGPACFIGYDEQSISIADDGCTFKKEGGSVRIYKNVNRIFSFNTSTKSLYSYATENKWFNEYEETGGTTPPPPHPGTTGKVLLWENTNSNLGMVYYQVDEGLYSSLPTAFIKGSNTGGNIENPTDVFCYDQEGNLYVVWFDTLSYYVRRYEKANNYSTDNTKDNQQKMVNNSGYTQLSASEKPTAIAVDVSDSAKGYVYYSYKTGEKVIIRNKWIKLNGFKTGSYLNKHTLNDLSGANDSKITSMTVNNDGLFVAQKNEYISPKKFKNVIHKYSDFEHPNTDYIGDTSGSILHGTGNNYVDENIFAMQIINGVLYYTVIKQDGQLENQNTNVVKTSAKLVKSSNSLNNAMNHQSFDTVWSTQSSSTDGYAPYRFIGTVPNKLIIASDGYYGDKSNIGDKAQNKNKVLSFVIGSWTLTSTDTNAKFSRELTYGASGFEWK